MKNAHRAKADFARVSAATVVRVKAAIAETAAATIAARAKADFVRVAAVLTTAEHARLKAAKNAKTFF